VKFSIRVLVTTTAGRDIFRGTGLAVTAVGPAATSASRSSHLRRAISRTGSRARTEKMPAFLDVAAAAEAHGPPDAPQAMQRTRGHSRRAAAGERRFFPVSSTLISEISATDSRALKATACISRKTRWHRSTSCGRSRYMNPKIPSA
jgi:hypothetical protein